MALSDYKITTANTTIQDLADRPNEDGLSAQQLKAKFDEFPELLRQKLNALIDDLTANGASQTELAALAADIEELTTALGSHSAGAASTSTSGHVKIDGETLVYNQAGQLSAVGGGVDSEALQEHSEQAAGTTVSGHVKIDGETLVYNEAGQLSAVSSGGSEGLSAHAAQVAGSNISGHVKIDGQTLVYNEAGQLSAADTALRSDFDEHAALAASATAQGHIKFDNQTLALNGSGQLAVTSAVVPYATEDEAIAATISNKVLNPATALAAITAHSFKPATIIVAASNSLRKQTADYICTGTADHLVIQQALDALPADGGRIFFLAGDYYLDMTDRTFDTVEYAAYLLQVNAPNVLFEGEGQSTVFYYQGENVYDFPRRVRMIHANADNIRFANFSLNGQKNNGVLTQVMGIEAAEDVTGIDISHCYFSQLTYSAVEMRAAKSNVSHNRFYANKYDIHGMNLELVISGNICCDSERGIFLYGMKNSVCSNNVVIGATDIAMNIEACSSTLIANNACADMPKGLLLSGVNGCLVVGNLFRRDRSDQETAYATGEYAITLEHSSYVRIIMNDIRNGSIAEVGTVTNCTKAFSSTDSSWNFS